MTESPYPYAKHWKNRQ
jgi:hypothetical protein